MPTTPIAGLPYPNLTSPNNPPADIQALASTLDPLVKPQIQSYTPLWSQSGGSTLSIGNGTLEGKYVQVGRMVVYRIRLERGSTTNLGTATYFWSLPVQADTFLQPGGNGIATVGGSFKSFSLRLVNSTTVAGLRPDDSSVGPSSFSWATSDTIVLSGAYLSAL